MTCTKHVWLQLLLFFSLEHTLKSLLYPSAHTLLFLGFVCSRRGWTKKRKALACALSCIMLPSEKNGFVLLEKSLVKTANTIIIHFVTGNHPRMLHPWRSCWWRRKRSWLQNKQEKWEEIYAIRVFHSNSLHSIQLRSVLWMRRKAS